MPPKAKKTSQEDFQRKRDQKAESKNKAKEDDAGSGEDDFDEDSEEKSEDIDRKFRLHRSVNVYITLPSGDEEILLDYDMCFTDKQAYQNWKAQGEGNEEGDLSQLQTNNNPFKPKQEGEEGEEQNQEENNVNFNFQKPLELEFKLLSFIR